jgi:hypothetical protein
VLSVVASVAWSIPILDYCDSDSDDDEDVFAVLSTTVTTFIICCEVQGCGVLYTATGVARRLWRHRHGHSQAAVLQ